MIGQRIRQRRQELGLTQEQIADKIGVKKNTISNYECDISSPNEGTMISLMELLECDANYLFGDYWKEPENVTPNVQRIMDNINMLNDDGLETLADYSDFLKGQMKFKKAQPDKNAREA